MKKKHKKWGHPFSWLVIEDGNSNSVYKVFTNIELVPWTDIELLTTITTQSKERKLGETTGIVKSILGKQPGKSKIYKSTR